MSVVVEDDNLSSYWIQLRVVLNCDMVTPRQRRVGAFYLNDNTYFLVSQSARKILLLTRLF